MIADFGISFKPESGSVTTVKDSKSPYYASIEQLDEEEAHPAFDIWSIGIIGYTLMAKKEPYQQFSVKKRKDAIEKQLREKLPEYYS